MGGVGAGRTGTFSSSFFFPAFIRVSEKRKKIRAAKEKRGGAKVLTVLGHRTCSRSSAQKSEPRKGDVPAGVGGGGSGGDICTAYCSITLRTQAKIELTIRSEFVFFFLSETLKTHRRRAEPPARFPHEAPRFKNKQTNKQNGSDSRAGKPRKRTKKTQLTLTGHTEPKWPPAALPVTVPEACSSALALAGRR